MTTVIGFIDAGEALKRKRSLKLPLGFRADGHIEPHDWRACRLILFDDAQYGDKDHGLVRSSSTQLVFLVQHVSSEQKWEEQRNRLIELGWCPIPHPIETFSHGSGFPFWRDVDLLLKNDRAEARAKVLEDMTSRYVTTQNCRALDVWAADAFLAEVDKDASLQQRRRESLQSLPESWRREINQQTDLSSKLAVADKLYHLRLGSL